MTEEMNKDSKPKNKCWVKFWVILVCLLILLIPLGFFNGIVNDREEYKFTVVKTMSQSWADEQTIHTPYLEITTHGKKGQLYPDDFSAQVQINTEIRKKGIFKIPVYTADVLLKGNFKNVKSVTKDKKSYLVFSVSDEKGFSEIPYAGIDKGVFKPAPDSRIIVPNLSDKHDFEIKYKIRGINNLYVSPKGTNNKISIQGNWPDPSFEGDILPDYRKVDNKGFSAKWSVPNIAIGNLPLTCGVSMLVPVDSYRMSQRAVKYGFLYLSLTFLTYFVYEISSKERKKIHPLQYMMVGAAMLVFYLLLLSMSEFIPFFAAYLIAAVMTISLIGAYTHFVLTKRKNKKFSALIMFILALLYSFLYTLLMLQDFSLILGSFAMFFIIALVMYSTKDVEWYDE